MAATQQGQYAQQETDSHQGLEATKSQKVKVQQGTEKHEIENVATESLRVEFVINTYPDLQPFLEMAVLLFEGIYEHKRMLDVMVPAQTNSSKN